MIPETITEGGWERVISAVEAVRGRVHRTTRALEKDQIPYALAGANAVAAWISEVDEAAIRNTPNVDIVVRRSDLSRVVETMEHTGFQYHESPRFIMFLDGPSKNVRSAVHILIAGEKFRHSDLLPIPDVSECRRLPVGQVLNIETLVVMKLVAHRLIDRVHIQDMIGVGLLDASWLPQIPPELRPRLQELLDHPDE